MELVAVRCHACLIGCRERVGAEAGKVVEAVCVYSTVVDDVGSLSLVQVAAGAINEVEVSAG